MKKISLPAFIATAMILSNAAFAQTANEIMEKSTNLPRPEYSKTELQMDVIEKNGSVEHRVINQFGDFKNGITRTVFDFRAPASVKETRLLQSEKANREDEKWIYMPSLKQTRRIVTTERTKSFVGSEFTYNDMTIRKFGDDEHVMLEDNVSMTIGGKKENMWKIKSTPIKNKMVEYAYRIQYIDKVSYLPLVIEYYNKQDVKIKTYTILNHIEVPGRNTKYWLRQTNLIENHQTGRKTKVWAERYVFDEQISDRYFTQNWLNTGK